MPSVLVGKASKSSRPWKSSEDCWMTCAAKQYHLQCCDQGLCEGWAMAAGTLDWDEFEAAFADDEMSRKWKLLDFHAEECKELFELLDDGDGGIETSEFFNGDSR